MSESFYSDREGWVAIHRCIIDSKLWSCSDATFRVAVYLMLEANHEPHPVRRIKIERGQTVRSITRISDDCNLSRKAVRHALKILAQDEFLITDEPFGAQQGHRITICNYATYQPKKNGRGTERAHEGNHAGNTNNNEDNDKNELEDTPVVPKKPKTKPELHDDAVKNAVIPVSLDTQAFNDALAEFAGSRRDMNKYLTERSIRATLRKLANFPVGQATSALMDSVANDYQGVFPERHANARPVNTTNLSTTKSPEHDISEPDDF